MKNNELRIFLGMHEQCGIMSRLNKAFNNMGIKNDFFCLSEDGFEQAQQTSSSLLKRYMKHKKRLEEKKSLFQIVESWFGSLYDLLHLFVYALKNYNAFIYIYGRGIFSYNALLMHFQAVEFFLLKVFKKKVIVWLVGSDSRAPYCGARVSDTLEQKKETQKKKKQIRMLEKNAILIDNPASSHFHTKEYLIFQNIGIPIDFHEVVERKKNESEKVVLLHAPSNKKIKGTAVVRKIVKEIEEMGLPIEYVEVSGVPHYVVLEKIAQSDILIDSIYSDTPMAGLATEAAMNGLPTISSGYYAKYYKDTLKDCIPPSLFCEPSELKEQLIRLIQNKEEREALGRAAKEFVRNYLISERCAERFISIINDDYPKEWLFTPDENEYIWGGGVSKKQVARNVISLIDLYGMKSLGLVPNSKLYQKYYHLYRFYQRRGKNGD